MWPLPTARDIFNFPRAKNTNQYEPNNNFNNLHFLDDRFFVSPFSRCIASTISRTLRIIVRWLRNKELLKLTK